uniref:Uncharacterized protein n=1 Tax=Anopheles minimus TaxID=112268 RepID=A0A182WM05_9DIPT
MASQRILKRAETALQYTKDLLLDDNSEDENDLAEDDECESETGNEPDEDVEEGDNENADKTKSDPASKGKKSSKGLGKTIKQLMGVIMEPFGCILLDKTMAELSKMKEQHSTLQADNDRLREELRDRQKLQQDLTSTLQTQNGKHQNEVKRLELELKNATDSLENMKQTNQLNVEESCRLRKDLDNILKEKGDLIKQLERKEVSHRAELDKHLKSLDEKQSENTKLTDSVDKNNH